ncbi:oxidoreductase [Magnaporthiopsis poae ATCC 64411]|uniref:Oxidoreductase n=1 Tax=Magnaporthiopsis poae (strain ATCC 64411 / 73-15) TaxID=644358 RepID=A0A0C4DND6_MAGP6|nr:oxidoreductase [Magnaporthiopsis poae ATCC 64411]
MTRVDNPRTTQAYLLVHGENARAPELADAIARRDVEAQRRVFADIFDGAGWESQRMVGALRGRMPEADDFYATDVCNVEGRSWTRGRITLLGDAGYSAATLSGFGTSGALIGAYVLAGELARHTEAESVDVATALREYDAKLRPLINEAQNIPGWVFKCGMQKSSWTITLTYWFLRIFTLLRLDKLMQMLGSDDKPWDLPNYPELENLKA